MRKTRPVMIGKRDGGLEPFDVAKLRRCLAGAMRTYDCDQRFADALARAIELHLRDLPETRPPTTDYIFGCAQRVLAETAMDHVAQHLARHRRRRAAQRRSLSVFDARQPGHASVRWRKALVAQTLETRHGLGRPVARILAGEIERRVLALEYSVVSTALIVELIRNELLAWGLADAALPGAPAASGVGVAAARQARKEC